MNEGEVKVNIQKENSQDEAAIQDEQPEVFEAQSSEEKPLGQMSKAELIGKIEQLQEEAKKNYDLYLRSEAESENVKKRNRKEKEEWVKYANETLVKEILPVMDNLEQAISHAQNEDALHALREGVELTLKGLKDTLTKSGLEEVKAMGEPFDPCFHHAVSEIEDEDAQTGHIINELQKGYIFNQRLIRPSMVVVNKGKPDDTTTNGRPA